jgi:hypothetical protein
MYVLNTRNKQLFYRIGYPQRPKVELLHKMSRLKEASYLLLAILR